MVAQFLFSLSRGRAIFREISTEMDVKTVTIIVKLRLEMKSKCSIFFFIYIVDKTTDHGKLLIC